MDSGIRSYTILLIANFILTIAGLILILYFINSKLSNDFNRKYSYVFIAPLVLLIVSNTFSFLFVKTKYPSQPISHTIEGFLYLFAILTIGAVLVNSFMMAAFISTAIERIDMKPNPMKNVLVYVVAPVFISSIINILTIIASFRLVKIIRKNMFTLADQIKKFGTPDN